MAPEVKDRSADAGRSALAIYDKGQVVVNSDRLSVEPGRLEAELAKGGDQTGVENLRLEPCNRWGAEQPNLGDTAGVAHDHLDQHGTIWNRRRRDLQGQVPGPEKGWRLAGALMVDRPVCETAAFLGLDDKPGARLDPWRFGRGPLRGRCAVPHRNRDPLRGAASAPHDQAGSHESDRRPGPVDVPASLHFLTRPSRWP